MKYLGQENRRQAEDFKKQLGCSIVLLKQTWSAATWALYINDNKYASLLPQTQSEYSHEFPTHLSTAPLICDYLNNILPYLRNHSYLSYLTTQCFAARNETAEKGNSAGWDIIKTSQFTNAFNKRQTVQLSRLFVRPTSRRSRHTLSS
jgi:hypothetical protein